MDLDEMKDRIRKVNAPAPETGTARYHTVDDLIAALRAEDSRDRKRLRRMVIFFAIAGLLCAGIFILTWIAPPDTSPGMNRAVLGLFALICLSLGMFGRMKSSELGGIDYTAPSRAFLMNVERRYRLVRGRDLVFIIPYLIALVGTSTAAMVTAAERYLPSLDPATILIIASVLFAVALGAGSLIGWRDWKKTKEPLLRKVQEMQANLNNDSTEER